ncbi:MAG: hypothetical protein ACJ77V_01995 [Chloroflexota bacterium]|jgi:hypothetical protein
MSDPKEDLRATSESIQHDARQVEALEREKEQLDPGDPRVEAISKKVEQLIAAMQAKAAAETDLSEELEASV